jgi:hypothetical protein
MKEGRVFQECREVLRDNQSRITPQPNHRLTMSYPWVETPISPKHLVEMALFSDILAREAEIIATLALSMTKAGELPTLKSFQLKRGDTIYARVINSANNGYVNMTNQNLSTSDAIESSVLDLMTGLGIQPIQAESPAEYGAWISKTLQLPGRVAQRKTIEDQFWQPAIPDTDSIRDVSIRLDRTGKLSDPIHARYVTEVNDNKMTEDQILSKETLCLDSDGEPVTEIKKIVFHYDHGEAQPPYAHVISHMVGEGKRHPVLRRPKSEKRVGDKAVQLAHEIVESLRATE